MGKCQKHLVIHLCEKLCLFIFKLIMFMLFVISGWKPLLLYVIPIWTNYIFIILQQLKKNSLLIPLKSCHVLVFYMVVRCPGSYGLSAAFQLNSRFNWLRCPSVRRKLELLTMNNGCREIYKPLMRSNPPKSHLNMYVDWLEWGCMCLGSMCSFVNKSWLYNYNAPTNPDWVTLNDVSWDVKLRLEQDERSLMWWQQKVSPYQQLWQVAVLLRNHPEGGIQLIVITI